MHLHAQEWIEAWEGDGGWRTRLSLLSKRLRTITTITTPQVTWVGAVLAASLLLVPLGAALLQASLKSPITLDRDAGPAWMFIFSLCLTLAPLLAALVIKALRWKWTISKAFEFISGKTANVAESHESLTPDPTSIEFEEFFRELMSETLKEKSRRLVIVVDNLDRVPAEDLTSIWASLQAFTRIGTERRHSWTERFWVVVPFDATEITKLWPNSAEADGKFSGQNALLDKSFHARFELPAPISSDWRSLLGQLIVRALPLHSEDGETICQLLSVVHPDHDPSPRELTALVNQIGSIHRQWPTHEFPIAHIAYFVILRRAGESVPKFLLTPNSIDARIELLLGKEIRENLAALAFNVEKARGFQTLLAGPIFAALSSGDSDALQKIVEAHPPGFWAVMPRLYQRFREIEDLSVPMFAKAIMNCPAIDSSVGLAHNLVCQLKGRANAVTSWQVNSEAEGVALAKLALATADHSLVDKISSALNVLLCTPKESGDLGGFADIPELLAAIGFGDELVRSGTEAPIFQHGPTGRKWLANLEFLRKYSSITAAAMQPVLSREASLDFMAKEIAKGNPEHLLGGVLALAKGAPDDWSEVVSAAWTTLSVEGRSDRMAVSASTILYLDRVFGKPELSAADDMIRRAAVVNMWANPSSASLSELSKFAYALMISYYPDLANKVVPEVNGSVAHAHLSKFLEMEPSEEQAQATYSLLSKYGLVPAFLGYEAERVNWDSVSRSLISCAFKDRTNWSADLLEYLVKVWPGNVLIEVFSDDDSLLVQFLQHSQSEGAFAPMLAEQLDQDMFSFWRYVGDKINLPGLKDWVIGGLRVLGKEAFVGIIADSEKWGEFAGIWAANAQGDASKALPVAYLDALVESVASLRESGEPHPEHIALASTLLTPELMPDFSRQVLNRLFETSYDARTLIAASPTPELATVFLAHPDAPDRLKLILDLRRTDLLEWMANVLEVANPATLRKLKKGAFGQRIGEAIHSEADPDIRRGLETIEVQLRRRA